MLVIQKRRKRNKSLNTILKMLVQVTAPYKYLIKGITNKCFFISTHIWICKVLFWKITSTDSMKVDCSLVISEWTWQAVVTRACWGWECSLMCESSYFYRKEEPKMPESTLNSNSKTFLRNKHEIPTEVRVVCIFDYLGAERGPKLFVSFNQCLQKTLCFRI